MRKPAPFCRFGIEVAAIERMGSAGWIILIDRYGLNETEAERLAAWLLKAAKWIREKETER